MKSKIELSGMVTVVVRGPDGNIKEEPRTWWRKLLRRSGRKMLYRHHNTITTQGTGLIADALLTTPTQKKIIEADGYMQVGTGWTGNSPAANTRCNTAVGAMMPIDAGFPQTEGTLGNTGQNILKYQSTFNVGTLNATGINEAALLNGNTADAKCLAYAQITPTANVTDADSLTLVWEITIRGE